MTAMTISQLAHRSGVPATTLRFYEKAGVLPQPARSTSGYRRYGEAALARVQFVHRAKALGIDLDDIAELVRLWDGDRCEPVQDRLRERVHEQRLATRRRLDELTRLADDLDRVGATIGATEACGPDCACLGGPAASDVVFDDAPDPLIGASCTLDAAELPRRLADWRALRARATSVEDLPAGVRLGLPEDEPMDRLSRLIASESECCSFYRFTLTVDGSRRSLAIEAEPTGGPAVRGLLGLD